MSTLPGGLYALCDDAVRPDMPLSEKARRVLDGGVRVLQLRMKSTAPREAIAISRKVTALCRQRGAVCLINDRVDYALLAGAHGVHVGDEDLPPEEARKLLGPDAIIGVTTRSLEMIEAAARAGATYAGLGPIFATQTKQVPHETLGLDGLRRIAQGSPLPIVAIAGIRLSNIGDVAAAGAHGAAVAGDLLSAPDPAEQARLLTAAFESGRTRRSIGA